MGSASRAAPTAKVAGPVVPAATTAPWMKKFIIINSSFLLRSFIIRIQIFLKIYFMREFLRFLEAA